MKSFIHVIILISFSLFSCEEVVAPFKLSDVKPGDLVIKSFKAKINKDTWQATKDISGSFQEKTLLIKGKSSDDVSIQIHVSTPHVSPGTYKIKVGSSYLITQKQDTLFSSKEGILVLGNTDNRVASGAFAFEVQDGLGVRYAISAGSFNGVKFR